MTALYVDTSAFLKLLWNEPETSRVEEILASEDEAVVSELTRLEKDVRIQTCEQPETQCPGCSPLLVSYRAGGSLIPAYPTTSRKTRR